jgi:hypothetical protein
MFLDSADSADLSVNRPRTESAYKRPPSVDSLRVPKKRHKPDDQYQPT